jgi:hypothetical protein
MRGVAELQAQEGRTGAFSFGERREGFIGYRLEA